jgi:hypothetical protein
MENMTSYRGLCISNNSVQLFIIYVPNLQLQCQLQTQHSVDNDNTAQTRMQGEFPIVRMRIFLYKNEYVI